jgi:hypothetical protein
MDGFSIRERLAELKAEIDEIARNEEHAYANFPTPNLLDHSQKSSGEIHRECPSL